MRSQSSPSPSTSSWSGMEERALQAPLRNASTPSILVSTRTSLLRGQGVDIPTRWRLGEHTPPRSIYLSVNPHTRPAAFPPVDPTPS